MQRIGVFSVLFVAKKAYKAMLTGNSSANLLKRKLRERQKTQYNQDNAGNQINIMKSKHLSYYSQLSHIHAEVRLKFRCQEAEQLFPKQHQIGPGGHNLHNISWTDFKVPCNCLLVSETLNIFLSFFQCRPDVAL